MSVLTFCNFVRIVARKSSQLLLLLLPSRSAKSTTLLALFRPQRKMRVTSPIVTQMTRLTLFLASVWLAGDFFGVFRHLAERDYYTDFSYPLDGDLRYLSYKLKRNLPLGSGSGSGSNRLPLNPPDQFPMLGRPPSCAPEVDIALLVKSALGNFARRQTIRSTWGNSELNSLNHTVSVQTFFLLGLPGLQGQDESLLERLQEESEDHGDVIQGSFLDTYFNQTLKTRMALQWGTLNCPTAKYFLLVDDDYFVSVKNLVRFVASPSTYPRRPNAGQESLLVKEHKQWHLYAGYVFHTAPHRHRFSKFFVSLSDYPFHLWPPYVTGGAKLLSGVTLEQLHFAGHFVRTLPFEDVYLGLVAKKLHFAPLHSPEFYFDKKEYSAENYADVVASHGFEDPGELARVWRAQRAAGLA